MGDISKIRMPDGTDLNLKDANARANRVFYGTCNTPAAEQAKVVVLAGGAADFELNAGTMVAVKFTYASAAATMTMNVNNSGAKNLCVYGSTTMNETTTTNGWPAEAVVLFVYDGTQWERTYWYNSTYWIDSCYVDTAAGTQAKVGRSSFYYANKGFLQVTVRYTNSYKGQITLNINGRGAKPVYYNGAVTSSSNYAVPAGTYIIYYDGNNYYFRNDDKLTANITGDAATVNGKTVQTNVPENAVFTDTTYSAGTGLSLNNGAFNHSNSITADTAGTSEDTSGSTLSVPYITYDEQGHITSSGAHTHTVTGFATSGHTHTTSIAKDTASTNQLSLAANTKYKLMAGGTNYIFTTPKDTTYTFASGDNQGEIKVTPSSGNAVNVAVNGLGSAAYTDTSAYSPAGHTHDYVPIAQGAANKGKFLVVNNSGNVEAVAMSVWQGGAY